MAPLTADFLIVAYGSKPNSELMDKFDASAVTEKGTVKVTPTMQVAGHPNWFAIGDVAETADGKTAVAAKGHGESQSPPLRTRRERDADTSLL